MVNTYFLTNKLIFSKNIIIDVTDKKFGRIAGKIAKLLMNNINNSSYLVHNIVIVNINKIDFSNNSLLKKNKVNLKIIFKNTIKTMLPKKLYKNIKHLKFYDNSTLSNELLDNFIILL